MKITLIVVTVLTVFSVRAQKSDNTELKLLKEHAYFDHEARLIDRKLVEARDVDRQKRALVILNGIQSPTANDYQHAAFIIACLGDSISNKQVIELMTMAVVLDPDCDKSLLAQTIDAELVRQGKLQLFGTQTYLWIGEDMGSSGLKMYEVDTLAVSDEQRRSYNVRSLSEHRSYLKTHRENPLVDLYENGKRMKDIAAICRTEFQENPSASKVAEYQFIRLGIYLKRKEKLAEAIMTYELATELYPQSFNLLDLLGECYVDTNQCDKAIPVFERSIQLNPYERLTHEKLNACKNGERNQ